MKFRAPKLVKGLCFSHICNNSKATVMKQLLRLGSNTNGVFGRVCETAVRVHAHSQTAAQKWSKQARMSEMWISAQPPKCVIFL